ncbi:MAG: neutral/alkaline non-lysosomal ceramidase N-terminal domain-containing protein [Smithellaceae bacterium]|nr:neutral/alkaline non-lysosomal ceramidase N-terminal domain-containing protein [Smithellaceae bacterium]
MKIARISLLVAVSLVIFTGCAAFKQTTHINIRNEQALPAVKSDTMLAGAAKTDVTPPPGMPMAGYSLWANYGKGFRTRLYARVLYLKPKAGRSVALVQCDLLTGSALLHHRIAELIAKDTDVGVDGLLIAGTHTHSGPGAFFDNNFYNDGAANAPGFDPVYFDYLAQRIAAAVVSAYDGRKPAKIATGTTEIWGVTHNRSIEAYMADKNVSAQDPPDIYHAVNPVLYMIRVDAKDDAGRYLPLAAISSFSIHGTAVPPANNLYNADVFAYSEREVEWGIKDKYKTSWEPVHAAFNGTHGDCSPDYRADMQGFIEARRLGQTVGRKALELFVSLDDKLKEDVPVRHLAKEIDLYKDRCLDGVCLCERPMVGMSLTAGAEDGPSPVLDVLPWFREGSARWFFTGSCQGSKRIVAGPLQSLILAKKDFPHALFLQAVRIDDTLLVPLPFEVTLEAGRRFAAECRNQLGAEVGKVDVISCANGYFGYVTTPEEYSRQHYEGGHTLYGPGTQPFIEAEIGHLMKDMKDMKEGAEGGLLPASWDYDLRVTKFYDRDAKAGGERKAQGKPVFHGARINGEPYWSFRWEDLPPHLLPWGKQLVRIEERGESGGWRTLVENGRPVDDSGYDLAVVCRGSFDGDTKGFYEARWFNPVVQGSAIYYRFVIAADGGGELYSEPFH